MPAILSDRPTLADRLNRTQYANAFARIALDAETPLVVGLFGDWGSGKTSLMRMIAARLERSGAHSVWFDAWQHQDDESPALALVHTMVEQLNLGDEGRKLLSVIATAFGSALLRAHTTLTASDVTALGEMYETERFQIRETRVRLTSHFAALVKRARGGKDKRLVFFIDDLDRCAGGPALAILEALKLYLGLDGCVYFVGADRGALERAIAGRYGPDRIYNARYLEKVVQLPFAIPPIHHDAMRGFVAAGLPPGLAGCEDMLVAGLGGNPRAVKRFINLLSLNHELALEARITDYDPRILALLLLIQFHDAERFAQLAAAPDDLRHVIERRDAEPSAALRAVFSLAVAPPPNLSEYVFLAQIVATADNAPGSGALSPDEAAARGLAPAPRRPAWHGSLVPWARDGTRASQTARDLAAERGPKGPSHQFKKNKAPPPHRRMRHDEG